MHARHMIHEFLFPSVGFIAHITEKLLLDSTLRFEMSCQVIFETIISSTITTIKPILKGFIGFNGFIHFCEKHKYVSLIKYINEKQSLFLGFNYILKKALECT